MRAVLCVQQLKKTHKPLREGRYHDFERELRHLCVLDSSRKFELLKKIEEEVINAFRKET